MAKEAKVGKRVKMFREKLKMTLADLAEKSGVSVAVIASIEEGEVLPALGVLTKLSRALGQRLGTFMDDQFKPDPIITRADQLSSVKVAHEGEELIICLEGEVELTYGGEKTVLRPGDTAYYNSVVKHVLRGVGGKPASIYGIVFMPF